MKDKINPKAFIAPILQTVEIDVNSPSLKERFQEEYRNEIQKLWEEFLVYQRIRKYAESHPLLLQRIEDTPLSVRAKNGLTVAGSSGYHPVFPGGAQDVPKYGSKDGKGNRELHQPGNGTGHKRG